MKLRNLRNRDCLGYPSNPLNPSNPQNPPSPSNPPNPQNQSNPLNPPSPSYPLSPPSPSHPSNPCPHPPSRHFKGSLISSYKYWHYNLC